LSVNVYLPRSVGPVNRRNRIEANASTSGSPGIDKIAIEHQRPDAPSLTVAMDRHQKSTGKPVMKNVAKIIELHGGLGALKSKPVRVEPPSSGFMRLCIEFVGTGPRGMPLVSVAHYSEQQGDLMADPDLVFELGADEDGPLSWKTGEWGPVSFTQHSTGTYQEAVFVQDGKVMVAPRLVASLRSFARMWDRNIKSQGYVVAYERQRRAEG
jgi:hypothetical protein